MEGRNIMNETFLQRPEFQKLGEQKIAILQELAQKAKGKEPMELLELLQIYGQKLTGGNAIAPAERTALLTAMEESLENEEKMQFQKAVQMLKIMGKL
jgi:hypothetical protein